MANTWKEPLGRDDRSDSEFVDRYHFDSGRLDSRGAGDGGQLDLFRMLPADGAGRTRPSGASGGDAGLSFLDLPMVESLPAIPFPAKRGSPDAALPGAADLGDVKTVSDTGAARDLVGADVSDADDLRRIEESIRWLMSAGTAPMPRPASLPAVRGLIPLDGRDDDSLLLDPETLFPPRPQRRRGNITAGMTRILLVSAIAAPTAYFIANWLQFPGTATTSGPVALSTLATTLALSDDQGAATHVVSMPASQPVNDTVPTAPPPTTHDGETAKTPSADPPAARVADLAGAIVPPPASEQPPAVVVPPPAETIAPPPPVLAPAKPAMRSEEIAMMVERGRVLFEAGDLVAARLFFRRAANAGDAAAAIAMGATYDPEVLAQRFTRGIEANPAEAQKWYERAREMGQHRTEMLAQGR